MSIIVTLGVEDLERTCEFYKHICRAAIERHRLQENMPPFLVLKQGDSTLLFREISTLQTLHPTIFEAVERHPRGLGVTIELEVDDFDTIQRLISHRQLHIAYELQDDESGWREIWLHDPDGYLVVLSQQQAVHFVG